jgi:hypothetical protein
MIGIFASANDYITDDGFALIESGIDWVLNQPPTEEFLNKSFTPQAGRFMIEFNAKPSAEKVDGFLGLSKDAATAYGDPVVDLLFNNEGFITAKNGDTYTSDNTLAYEANKNYVCKLVIDVPNSVYSVWVTPEGGNEILLGENYAFVSASDSLGWITTKMSFDPQWGGAEGLVYVTGIKISDVTVGIEDKISASPTEFKLHQNYPNPFNPSTEIAFTLKQAAQTTLSVFNLLGQKVATLVDKKLTHGQYQVTFDAVNLTSGVYFYELKTDNHVQVKKMMLMK